MGYFRKATLHAQLIRRPGFDTFASLLLVYENWYTIVAKRLGYEPASSQFVSRLCPGLAIHTLPVFPVSCSLTCRAPHHLFASSTKSLLSLGPVFLPFNFPNRDYTDYQ